MIEQGQTLSRLAPSNSNTPINTIQSERMHRLSIFQHDIVGYINNKATKYMLRNGQLTEAETTIGMFTRQEGDMAVAQSLFEMQCSWYELECGAAHFRAGAIGKALKNFVAVEKHFLDFCEDQFDFHGYCLRKVTLRAYVQLLRMQDKLRGHHLFCRAARAAIRCYLVLADKPDPAAVAAQLEVDYAAMTPAARKKAKAAARKQAALELRRLARRRSEQIDAVNSVDATSVYRGCLRRWRQENSVAVQLANVGIVSSCARGLRGDEVVHAPPDDASALAALIIDGL